MIAERVVRVKEFFCWHQWYDSQIGHQRDFEVEEQWCIHCGKWRRKPTMYHEKYPTRYAIKMFSYDFVRKVSYSGYVRKENYVCAICGKPMFECFIACSDECWNQFVEGL